MAVRKVKDRMRALMTMVLENWAREERGEPVGGIPLHAVFLGPPGEEERGASLRGSLRRNEGRLCGDL